MTSQRLPWDRVRLVAMDVDGVLTDGRVLVGPDGGESISFHVHDGAGIRFLQWAGVRTAWISGRSGRAVEARAHALGVDAVRFGCEEKLGPFRDLLGSLGLRPEDVCFIGDDLIDVPLLLAAGIGVAVADARPEVRGAARYVTRAAGGAGAVREVADLVVGALGKWDEIRARYGDGGP